MKITKHIWLSLFLILLVVLLGVFIRKQTEPEARFPLRLGLDLRSGTELVYLADTSNTENPREAMESLKEVIERRVNVFGVSEPLVQTESAGLVSGNKEDRLIVGLPGVTDVEEAKAMIGKTPVLEFRLLRPEAENILAQATSEVDLDAIFLPASLTGQYLSRARLEFDQTLGTPIVGLEFNAEGSRMFSQITREHKGEALAIVLDGAVLSNPVIQEEIRDGKAQITGNFTNQEARELVRNLNYGALPVPISFFTSHTVGASLGDSALDAGVRAGIWGFLALSIFLILWYRLPGLIAVLALGSYVVFALSIFLVVPVTLTAAGIAGFILSIGMAVDANILIFERTREELSSGKEVRRAIEEGFSRAWLSIRDSNISSIITAIVLFWLGTSAVKGFALTLGIGVLVSMFTAITLSRTFLLAIASPKDSKFKKFLFSNGLHLR